MIGLEAGMHGFNLLLQVFVLDLLLSGDNAIVIALACRHLPARQMRQAVFMGMGAAVALRVLFTSVIGFVLYVPGLKLLGMLALVVIAIKLLVHEPDQEAVDGPSAKSFWPAVGLIIFADLTMSLDNVMALAAIAQGNVSILILGLLLSVPLLMAGSVFVSGLLHRYPVLVPAGCALLGWIAGDIGSSDPLIADWISAQAPGLTVAMPSACALFVLLESRIVRRNLLADPATEQPVSIPPVVALAAGPVSDAAVRPMLIKPALWQRKGLRRAAITLCTIPLLSYVGWSVIYGGIVQGGYMPTPRQPHRYECPGFNGPFAFFYQHGKDTVRIRANGGALDGAIIKGRLEWMNASHASSLLGFTPPQEITNDDATSIRLDGGSFSQMVCVKQDVGH